MKRDTQHNGSVVKPSVIYAECHGAKNFSRLPRLFGQGGVSKPVRVNLIESDHWPVL